MWRVATFRPVTLFSLRDSAATSMGGKSLLVPSMYAVKMALLDASFRVDGGGEGDFPWVRDLRIRLAPPPTAVVTNAFIKVLREDRQGQQAYIPAPAAREMVFFAGDLEIALDAGPLAADQVNRLDYLLAHINYLGKRGGFFQLHGIRSEPALASSFGFVVGDDGRSLSDQQLVQFLDDMAPAAAWQAINSYDPAAARVGRDRVQVPVAVPYRLVAASRGYSLYRRTA